MTAYTLMLSQTVPNNAPNGQPAVPVSVIGGPTRATFTFSLSAVSEYPAEAVVLATQPGFTYPNQQVIYDPILVMTISPGVVRVSEDLAFGAPYNSFAAELLMIERGQTVSASVTMAV